MNSDQENSTILTLQDKVTQLKETVKTYQELNSILSKKVQELKISLNISNMEVNATRNELTLEKLKSSELRNSMVKVNIQVSQFLSSYVATMQQCSEKTDLDINLPGNDEVGSNENRKSLVKPPSRAQAAYDPDRTNILNTICEEAEASRFSISTDPGARTSTPLPVTNVLKEMQIPNQIARSEENLISDTPRREVENCFGPVRRISQESNDDDETRNSVISTGGEVDTSYVEAEQSLPHIEQNDDSSITEKDETVVNTAAPVLESPPEELSAGEVDERIELTLVSPEQNSEVECEPPSVQATILRAFNINMSVFEPSDSMLESFRKNFLRLSRESASSSRDSDVPAVSQNDQVEHAEVEESHKSHSPRRKRSSSEDLDDSFETQRKRQVTEESDEAVDTHAAKKTSTRPDTHEESTSSSSEPVKMNSRRKKIVERASSVESNASLVTCSSVASFESAYSQGASSTTDFGSDASTNTKKTKSRLRKVTKEIPQRRSRPKRKARMNVGSLTEKPLGTKLRRSK